jgi:hypothetical protein
MLMSRRLVVRQPKDIALHKKVKSHIAAQHHSV